MLPEPVASLRASHCSPVFYLLDNGKRRNISALGLRVIICFIHRGIIALTFNLWTGDGSVLPHCMPAVHSHILKKRLRRSFLWQVWGGQKGVFFGVMKRKLVPGPYVCLHTFPKSAAVDVPIDRLACIANLLKLTVQPVSRCFGDAIHACVQMAAAVVCLPQTVRRGRDIVRCNVADRGCGAGGRRDCVPDEYFFVLSRLRMKGHFNSQKCASENLMVLSSERTLISSDCMTLALRAVAPNHDNSLCIFICLRPRGVQL